MTGGQLAARPARVDGGRGGDKPPHNERRPQADLLTGRARRARRGRAGRGRFSCSAVRSPGPQNDAAPDDNAGPGRGAEAGEGGNEQGAQRLRAAADRRSRAGIKPCKRRPQADNLLLRAFTRERGRSGAPEPPGRAATAGLRKFCGPDRAGAKLLPRGTA
ncbi:hypothetical protein ELQ56_23630 [Salmonella enterica subsp. enterica serovar Lerum]|nr:hypothetical protein [Salmonella enterica subsp. enterica serovar Lerum]